jgi:hypothetical protein
VAQKSKKGGVGGEAGVPGEFFTLTPLLPASPPFSWPVRENAGGVSLSHFFKSSA